MSAPSSSWHTEHLHRLVAGIQKHDPVAANELFHRVILRLECLARRMLRRYPVVRAQEQTADVLQGASLRLLGALREVTPKNTQHFFNLASREIRRQLIDLARHYRRGAHQPLHEHADPVAPGTGSGEREDLEHWVALHEGVERLPAEEREVVSLRHYHGWTWEQIADLLGVNERTARRLWDRACLSLQESLGGWTPPAEDESDPPRGNTS